MRTYIVYYLAEKNDECIDCEIDIKAERIELALIAFKHKSIIHKRVTGIVEKNN